MYDWKEGRDEAGKVELEALDPQQTGWVFHSQKRGQGVVPLISGEEVEKVGLLTERSNVVGSALPFVCLVSVSGGLFIGG